MGEPEDGRDLVRRRGGDEWLLLTHPDRVDPQHGQDDVQLVDEVVHIGAVGLGQRRTGWLSTVLEFDPSGAGRKLDQACFEVADVALGQVLIGGRDDHHSVPELLVPLVVPQPIGDVLGFADVASNAADRGLIVAQEQVDAWPLSLGPPQ